MIRRTATFITLAMLASGCVGGPRTFTPTLSVTDAALAAETPPQAVVRNCDSLVRAGRRADFRDRRGGDAAAGAGAAAGVGAGGLAVGSAVAGFTGMGIATLAVAAMPVVGVLAAYGVSRSRRSRAEQAIQTAMGDCLAEHGYRVTSWDRVQPESGSTKPEA